MIVRVEMRHTRYRDADSCDAYMEALMWGLVVGEVQQRS